MPARPLPVKPSPFLACAIALLCALTPMPSHAQTLAVAELRVGTAENAQNVLYLQAILAALAQEPHPDLHVASPQETAALLRTDRACVPRALTPDQREILDAARRRGTAFLDAADAANAVIALAAASALHEAGLASTDADDSLRAAYLDVLMQLATAQLIVKMPDSAAETLHTVVTVFGAQANVTEENYRPDVVALFRGVAGEASRAAKGRLTVTADLRGAHAIVDGVDRGVVPVVIENLLPGGHAVSVRAGVAQSLLHRVQVRADRPAERAIRVRFERHLRFGEAQVSLDYPDLASARLGVTEDAIALGQALGVEQLLLLGVVDGTLYAWRIDVARARADRTLSARVPPSGTSPRVTARVLDIVLGPLPDGDADVAGLQHPSAAWYTSAPGWVFGAAALGALGVGVAYAHDFASAPGQPASDADTAATGRVISAASLGAGAVFAGIAGYFFWAKTRPPREAASAVALPPADFGSRRTAFASQPLETSP